MANTFSQYTGTGSQTDYAIGFPYLLSANVKVYLDGVADTDFEFLSSSTIQMDTAPGSGVQVKVVRETNQDTILTDFEDGNNLVENDLDTATLQNFYLIQEALDSIGLFGVENLATSAHILIGDGTDFVNKALSGDATLSAAGVLTISGLDASKIADGSVSDTEFQYLNGVTSAIQTQLDGITAGTVTTIDDDNFTLQDDGDSTKKGQFQLSGVTTGNTRTITWPDADITLPSSFVSISSSDTFTNKSISLGSNTLTSTIAQLNTALSDGSVATLAGSETLTNKTLGASTLSGQITGADQIISAINNKDVAYITYAHGDTLGADIALNMNNGNVHTATISTDAVAISVTNAVASDEMQCGILYLTNGGSQTVTFTAGDFEGGVAPTLTTSGIDKLGWSTIDGGTTIHWVPISLDSK